MRREGKLVPLVLASGILMVRWGRLFALDVFAMGKSVINSGGAVGDLVGSQLSLHLCS